MCVCVGGRGWHSSYPSLLPPRISHCLSYIWTLKFSDCVPIMNVWFLVYEHKYYGGEIIESFLRHHNFRLLRVSWRVVPPFLQSVLSKATANLIYNWTVWRSLIFSRMRHGGRRQTLRSIVPANLRDWITLLIANRIYSSCTEMRCYSEVFVLKVVLAKLHWTNKVLIRIQNVQYSLPFLSSLVSILCILSVIPYSDMLVVVNLNKRTMNQFLCFIIMK